MPLISRTLASAAPLVFLGAALFAQSQFPQGRWPSPQLSYPVPGQEYTPPFADSAAAPDAPVIYSHSDDVLPDQSFFLAGRGFTGAEVILWGPSAVNPGGQRWAAKIQSQTDETILATVPEEAPAGLYLAWVGREGKWSAPFRLNAPQIWWSTPDRAAPGQLIRLCGRNLSQKPDSVTAAVYLKAGNRPAVRLIPTEIDKYYIDVRLPPALAPGDYEVWVHAGFGDSHGWSAPLRITMQPDPGPRASHDWDGRTGALQDVVRQVSKAGGGVVRLPAGVFTLPATLDLPEGVILIGAGRDKTTLQLEPNPGQPLPAVGPGWPRPWDERRAAIWISGHRTGLRDLTVLANARVNWGLLVELPGGRDWLDDVQLLNVRIAGADARGIETGAIRFQHVSRARLENSELAGRAPVFLAGLRQGWISSNRLIPASRHGGAAEGAILARTETLAQSVFQDNVLANPAGGSPQVRRLIWVSTGRGSVNQNLFLRNRAENPRYSGVPGTDQNVGETILFESNMRYAFYGVPAAAESARLTLPEDAPVLPPLTDEGTLEPIASEYYAVVLGGQGMGQVRRIRSRNGRVLTLEEPWRVIPDKTSRVLISTLFARNLVLENDTREGMTGIQLWIGGWENVFARNIIARERRQCIYLYAATTTLEPQMPNTWNRGIGVLLFNTVEENNMEECSHGIMLNANNGNQPVEWPRALGNIFRRNTAAGSRFSGIHLAGQVPEGTQASTLGTVIEFNVLRDQPSGITGTSGAEQTLVRRNLIYVWDKTLLDAGASSLNLKGAGTVTEHNSMEGPTGDTLKR